MTLVWSLAYLVLGLGLLWLLIGLGCFVYLILGFVHHYGEYGGPSWERQR